jgi:signal transduction histidine kinase
VKAEQGQRLLRAYRTLDGVTRLVDETTGEAELLRDTCRLAVEDAGYRLAWVGYADADAERHVRPVAHFGWDDGYLDTIDVRWDDGPHGRGPTGTAIRTNKPCVAQNIAHDQAFEPWRAQALHRGFASSAAFPLHDGDRVFGALNLYAPEPDAFDPDEIALLERMAAVLGHGVCSARGRLRLGQMEQALQRLDRLGAAGRIAATLAHDVNNCLAIVLPCLDELRGNPLADEARIAVERAIALNQQLLRLGKTKPSHAALEPPLDVDATLEASLGLLRRAAGSAEVIPELHAHGECVVIAQAELEQILTNLLLNARDAMPDGGAVHVVTRKLALKEPLPAPYVGVAPGEYVSIAVRDTGTGITPEAREHLFEPLFTTKGDRGTGLGLASVFGIVTQHAGHVFVDTALGRGTTFDILLPRAPDTSG